MTGKEEVCARGVRLALVILTALLYAPVFQFTFVTLDDSLYFDTHIRRGFSWASLWWCLTTTTGFLWHPLTWISHMLDCQFFGSLFGWHHMTNVALHIFSAVMLFYLLLRMTSALWRSAMVAALFAWHPLHVESVAWLAERKDVLSALFWMLASWAYVCYVEQSRKSVRKKPSWAWYLLSLIFFALGLMSKPILVTMPFTLLLFDCWPLGRLNPKSGVFSKDFLALVVEKIPFFVLALLFSILTMVAVGQHAASLKNLPLSFRLTTVVTSYFLYVWKTVWPGHMVVLYPFDFKWAEWQIVGCCIFIIVVSLLAIVFRKTRPYFLVGWLWYLGTLVPVIGLVQVGTQQIADRYTYLPSIGLFVIICWSAFDLLGGIKHGPLVLGGLAWAALLACVLTAGNQLQYWQNSATLFGHNLEVYPNNFFVHADFGGYYYQEHDLKRAIEECQKSIHLDQTYAYSHTILGSALFDEGKNSEAIDQFIIALQIDPISEDAHIAYAKALLTQDQADDASRQLATVIAADPDNPQAHYLLGKALMKQGNLDAAAAQFTTAMSFVEKYVDAQFQLAVVQAKQGKTDDAVKNYRDGMGVPTNGDDSLVLNNLAWVLAASPHVEDRDGAKAVELATRARDMDNAKTPVILGTLADAYAEAGRFDEAVATAQQAHDLAVEKGLKDLAARNLELQEIYRTHKAYHESLDFKQ